MRAIVIDVLLPLGTERERAVTAVRKRRGSPRVERAERPKVEK